MILFIDNYDSFTFNLVRYFAELGADVQVFRNDAIDLATIQALKPQAIVISPGPCTPETAGISLDIVRHLSEHIPILGVCLGHQVIGHIYGGRVIRAPVPVHGKVHSIIHTNQGLWQGLPSPVQGTRYHSLIVERESLPEELIVSAWLEDDPSIVMGLHHRSRPLYGIQYHPESVLTEHGYDILANFLKVV